MSVSSSPVAWLRRDSSGQPVDVTLDAALAQNWTLRGHTVQEVALPTPTPMATPTTLPDALASLARLQRRYWSLIAALKVDEIHPYEAHRRACVTLDLFLNSSADQLLDRRCDGGYPQCDRSGDCGGLHCPRRYLSERLIDTLEPCDVDPRL